jgi:hypothetical protein
MLGEDRAPVVVRLAESDVLPAYARESKVEATDT